MKRWMIMLVVFCLFPFNALAAKYALLVGINAYPFPNTLQFCVHDAQKMQQVLVEKFGFPQANIKTVLDRQATFQGIATAFQTHLIQQAQPGDVVVFYYSGHGGQTLDFNGDEADGYDEVLCPVDITGIDPNTWLTDDILGSWLAQLRTDRVTVILDACFSGTGTRVSTGLKPKVMDLGFVIPPGKRIKTSRNDSPMRHILIAGAADDQVSFESQEKKDGVLTGFLYDVLVNVASDLTYQTLMAQVVPLVTAYVQTNFQETQTPQLEGQDTSAPVFWGMTPQTPPAAMLPTPTPSQEGNPVQPSQEGNPATTAVVTTTASETVQHADFTLNVSTDKTHYTAGDLMTVTIQADRDCYVRLYLVSADNQVQQLFPNQWQRDNFVKGGQTVKIPGETADFQFRMAAPFGLEILKAVASTAQFADVKNMNWEGKTFVTFGNARLPDVIDRGAIVEAKPARPQISEAVAIYEVRPR